MDHLDQLQRAVTALGTLPVRGLVTTGPAIDPDQIAAPEGVTVVRSAPHRQVLAHTDVLVTHGGHGTVMKGLLAGVPIVCMPTGRDQPDNAARLVHRGAGVKISKKASPAKIAAAIEHVLDDASFQSAAARLGERPPRRGRKRRRTRPNSKPSPHRLAATTTVRIDAPYRRGTPLRRRPGEAAAVTAGGHGTAHVAAP